MYYPTGNFFCHVNYSSFHAQVFFHAQIFFQHYNYMVKIATHNSFFMNINLLTTRYVKNYFLVFSTSMK